MPKPTYKNCRLCGKPSSEVGPLSHTRLCQGCAVPRFEANALAMHEKSGTFYVHWARRSLLAATRALVASQETEP